MVKIWKEVSKILCRSFLFNLLSVSAYPGPRGSVRSLSSFLSNEHERTGFTNHFHNKKLDRFINKQKNKSC